MMQNYNQKSVKKQLFLSLFLLMFSLGVTAQITSFPWTETFEDNSTSRADWTQIYEVNTMAWTYATSPSTGGYVGGASSTTAYEGTTFANFPGTSHLFDKTKLVSPVLNLSGVINPTLSFFYRNPFWSPDQNWLRIFYRNSDSSPWVQITELHTDVSTWTSSGNFALPEPSATYQIAIECETDYGYSTTVDSVKVEGTLGVTDFSKALISYYPNPTENILNFSSTEIISNMSIVNLLGQKVMEVKTNSNQGQIDLSDLPSGNYILNANTEYGLETFKIVKK